MKGPWDLWGRQQDDMETLQTDVMRFMAILGLCLAAIFSLVRSPEFQPVQTDQRDAPAKSLRQSAESELPALAHSLDQRPQAVTAMQPRHETASEEVAIVDPAVGFSLEFASADDLRRLVRTSGRLYVTDGEHYWQWSNGNYTRREAPAAYYQMQAETVPIEFRQGLPSGTPLSQLLWGVELPAHTADAIGSLMRDNRGGTLVISADGTVHLDDNG